MKRSDQQSVIVYLVDAIFEPLRSHPELLDLTGCVATFQGRETDSFKGKLLCASRRRKSKRKHRTLWSMARRLYKRWRKVSRITGKTRMKAHINRKSLIRGYGCISQYRICELWVRLQWLTDANRRTSRFSMTAPEERQKVRANDRKPIVSDLLKIQA